MQKLAPDQMLMMIGQEYILLHVQEPVLYVIRKQDRMAPDSVKPLVDYYILAGVIYQAPDLNSIIQSRVLNSALNLQSALEEFRSLSSFNPSTGFSWKSQQTNKDDKKTVQKMQRPDEYSRFQKKIEGLVKNFSESN